MSREDNFVGTRPVSEAHSFDIAALEAWLGAHMTDFKGPLTVEMFKPAALAAMKKKRANFEQIVEFCRSPRAFLKHLDAAGVDRAVIRELERRGHDLRLAGYETGAATKRTSVMAMTTVHAVRRHRRDTHGPSMPLWIFARLGAMRRSFSFSTWSCSFLLIFS